MNKETRLLAAIDDVFGMGSKIKSQFRKVGQDFDERTNEHVFYIEYRFQCQAADSASTSQPGNRSTAG
jgi:hypothetical protein